MSVTLMTVIIIASFLTLLFMGLPVAFALLGASVLFAALLIDPGVLYTAYSNTFKIITTDLFIAVPLFVFMATLLQYSGLATGLYETMYKWFAGLNGGLAIGTVAMCTMIAAMTGLGGTGVVTIGYMGFPEMEKRGYDRKISLGCIPPGGALGPLIPPSVLMVIIGGFSQLSVGRLFMGGVFPGLLMAVFFMLYIWIMCKRNPAMGPAIPVNERATWKEKFISLRGIILPVLVIILVLGTIYTGVATPTEAAGIGAFGVIISAAIYKQLNWKNIRNATIAAMKINAMVMWLLVGGSTFASLLTMTGISAFIRDSIVAANMSPMGVLIIMMLIALFLGMLMDGAAITMILIPIFMPIVLTIGIDPLWFGLLFTVNMIIGYITPPFGMCLFFTKGIVPADVSMGQIYRAVAPYCVIMGVVLILCVLFPPILLWLPSKMIS